MIANETTHHKRPNDTRKLKQLQVTALTRMAFINEQSPYLIVSYKRPQNEKNTSFDKSL